MNKTKKKNLWLGTQKTGGKAAGAIVVWGLVFALLAYLATVLLPGASAPDECPIVFSEVMTANESAYPAEDGGFYDWFEIKNASAEPVSLGTYKVSNTYDSRSALNLPDYELAPGERIVVYCAGVNDETRLYADFFLNKDGDSLYIFDHKGHVLSSMQVPALGKGMVYALDEESGEWASSAYYTPGSENTRAAYESIVSEVYAGSLELSELMASNSDTVYDSDGETPDWIEVHNTTSENLSLAGWSLTTDLHDRRQWSFPDAEIGPDGYSVVYASAKTGAEGEMHASFKLSASGETLYLIDPLGRIASEMRYEALDKDISLSRRRDGSISTAVEPSPGFANTSYGATQALGSRWRTANANAEGIYINEAVCQMATYSDWIEIYNSNAEAVDLSGWWLSDNPDHPRKWEFPQDTYIQPGEYKILFLNGGVENPSDPAGLRVDFALSITGNETLVLSRPDGTAVDTMLLRAQKSQVSYGRADGYNEYRWFTSPTPGAANTGASYGGSAGQVEFSRSGGRITGGAFTLELISPDGLPVYYTTDGSNPTEFSPQYTSPIEISSTTVVKAAAWAEGYLPSAAAANTYVFDNTGDLRLVCVSGDRETLNGSSGVLNTGSKTSIETYVEVYDYDGSLMISQGAELTTSGRAYRVTFAQKAFRLVAKSIYGNATFDAQLFTKRDYEVSNSFVMRASGQDCQRSHMVDSVITSLASETGLFYQETELAEVYVNGEYWGMYNMRERVDPFTLAQYEGWDNPDAIDMVESNTMYSVQGSSQNIREVMQRVHRTDLTNPANLEALRQYIDVENYLDYVIMQIYTANEDLNNVRMYRNTEGDGKWRWALFDLDLAYRNDKNSVNMWLKGGDVGSITTQNAELFVKLMENAEMRDYFLTRFGEMLADELSAENVFGLISERYDAIEDEMRSNCERWGWSHGSWTNYVKKIAQYAINRPPRLIEFTQGAFKLTDAEVQKYFGDAIEKINTFVPTR